MYKINNKSSRKNKKSNRNNKKLTNIATLQSETNSDMPKRNMSAFILIALVVFFLWIGPPFSQILVVVLTLQLCVEVSTLFWNHYSPKGIAIFVASLLSVLIFSVLLWEALGSFEGVRVLIWVCITVLASDASALFAGRYFKGWHPVPCISPHKTLSGYIGGYIGGMSATLLFLLASHLLPHLFSYFPRGIAGISPSWSLALLTLGVVFFGQVGDLFQSVAKRFWGVRDSGDLIPGHGGMWDRVDSLVLAFLGLSLISGTLWDSLVNCFQFSPLAGGYVTWIETFF